MSEDEYSTTDAQCSEGGVNNENWETERTRSGVSRALQFFLGSVWGLLALNSLVLPAISIMLSDYLQHVVSVSIGVPLAIILCYIVFLFTYTLRFSARGYELLRQIREGCQPTLALIALLAYTTALIMALTVTFALEEGLARALRTIFFSLTFASVTLSAMLMSIRSFDRKELEDWQAAHARQAIERRFNPYISGGPIREPDMFFGREEALAELLNTIHNNHVAIYGERRIGKTSLLHQLDNRLREMKDLEYLFIPAFVNLQGVPAGRLFYILMSAIARSCQPHIGSLDLIYATKKEGYDAYDLVDDLETVLEALETTTDKQIRLVLLLDEGDELNEYDPRVQARLRGVFMTKAGRYLRMVWSGLSIDKEWKLDTSPWYNLFAIETHLAPFTSEEALSLIQEPVKGIYRYDKDAIELILQYSEHKPFRIQQICLATINRVLAQERRRVTKEDVERAYQGLIAEEAVSRKVGERGKVGLLEKQVAEGGIEYQVNTDGQGDP